MLGERDEALGKVWHLPNPETVTPRELVRLLQQAAGKQPGVTVLGRFGIRVLGLFVPPLRGITEMAYEWEQPYVVDHSAFTAAFGLAATPLRQAVADTVLWVRSSR